MSALSASDVPTASASGAGTVLDVVGAVAVGAGCLVVVACAVAAVLVRGVYRRLHLLSPVTSLGGPLIGLGLVLANGVSLTSGTVLLVVGLLALTGPVLVTAVGRVAALRDGLIDGDDGEDGEGEAS